MFELALNVNSNSFFAMNHAAKMKHYFIPPTSFLELLSSRHIRCNLLLFGCYVMNNFHIACIEYLNAIISGNENFS